MDTTETTRLRALCAAASADTEDLRGSVRDVLAAIPALCDAIDARDRGLAAVTAERDQLVADAAATAARSVEEWADVARLVGLDRSALPLDVRRAVEHELAERDAARDALDRVTAERDALLALAPHPSKRTGIRCARCGRDGGVSAGDALPVCGWCADAVTVERERDDLRAVLETRDAELTLAHERIAELEAIITGRTTPPTSAVTARQASPTEPGLWWRYEGSEAPVLCYAVTQPLGAMGAHGIVRAIWYSTAPCDGVRWTRCVPPTESVGDRFRAAGERTHVADLEREVLRLRDEADARAEGDAEAVAAARREGAEAMRAACDDACARIAEKHRIMGTTHSGAMATWVDGIENGAKLCACFVRALPLPGDATPAGEVTP